MTKRITVDEKALHSVTTQLLPIYRACKPYEHTFHLRAVGHTLEVSLTETWTHATFELPILEPENSDAQMTLSEQTFKRLRELLRYPKRNGEVTIDFEHHKISRGVLTLKLHDVDNEPMEQIHVSDHGVGTTVGALDKMLSHTLPFVDPHDVRVYLRGIHLSANDGRIRAAGTNGHAIGIHHSELLVGDFPEKGIILGNVAAQTLEKALHALPRNWHNHPVSIGYSERGMVFHGPGFCVRFFGDFGNYPNISAIYPTEPLHSVALDLQHVHDATRTLKVTTNSNPPILILNGSTTVRFPIGEDQEPINLGTLTEDLPVPIGLNMRYVRLLTKTLGRDASSAHLEYSTTLAEVEKEQSRCYSGAVRIWSDASFEAIVMPMRI